MMGRAPTHKRTLGPNTRVRELCNISGFTGECLKLRRRNKYRLEAIDLCLVPNVGLSTDFKALKFDKYKGSSCPRVHLAMYCRKMAAHIYDDKILIHCFQDNLTGATLNWYSA
ncbi:hypothetical protein CR513_42168, partial [Mucuna pruriens]